MTHRVRLFIGVALLPLALFAFLPLVSSGQQKNLGSKIERKKDQIAWRKGRERVLSSDVAGFTRKINALQGDITVLQTKQVRLQANLDRKRAELARIQEDLRRERLRLARLRARLAEARAALSKRLVELYKADQPDLVTVVLESNGFADLLERTEFMQRVSHQDARIINIVVKAKAEATATAKRLDKLEKRQARVAKEIESQRDEVSTGEGARKPQRQVRGLGAGRGEAHAPGARDQALHELGPAHLGFVRGAPVRALRHLLLHRLDHGRMRVAEQQRAMPAEIIDVLVAVDVPLARSRRARRVDRIRQQGAGIVGQPGRNGLAGLFVELRGAGGPGAVLGLDPRIGQRLHAFTGIRTRAARPSSPATSSR